MFKRLRESDPWLWFAVAGLSLCGFMALASAMTKNGGVDPSFWFQVVFVLVMAAAALAIACTDYRLMTDYAVVLYGVLLVVLAGLLVVGKVTRGAQSWVGIGSVRFQPSELVKPVALLMACQLLTSGPRPRMTMRRFCQLAAVLGGPAVLVVLQPDMGTGLCLAMIFAMLLFFSDLNLRELAVIGAVLAIVGAGGAVVGWKYFLKDYQKDRIRTFLSPESDSRDTGYHVAQSKIAVGSGETFGRGLFKGTQSRNRFLPEPSTDFIFAVWAEETGFAGSALVLALFGLLFARLFRAGRMARDQLGVYLVAGIAAIFLYHVAINIGMVIGATPTTGIPLPFFSYGRSSAMATFLCVGLAQSVYVRRFGT